MRCSLTDSWMASRSSISSHGLPLLGGGNRQESVVDSSRPRRSKVITWPGQSCSIPRTIVPGPMTNPFQTTDATATGSREGEAIKPEARRARTSEANASRQFPFGSGFLQR